MDYEYNKAVQDLVKASLHEDIGRGDLTSLSCLEPDTVKARIAAKSSGILSGVVPAMLVFEVVDSANTVSFLLNAGDHFNSGDTIAEIEGFNQTILSSERVALNFMGRLSGIATLTNKFVEKVRGHSCRILDTRKTTPGWRLLEKTAVRHGGGMNHRLGLYDMVLIKDNHIASVGSISDSVKRVREFLDTPEFRLQFETTKDQIVLEVEVTSESQVREAIDAGVDRLLLDNLSIESLKELVRVARDLSQSVKLEASGNVTLDNVAAIAATGVDCISVGALTHSAPVADFSMLIDQT